jgi:hypothetical protein
LSLVRFVAGRTVLIFVRAAVPPSFVSILIVTVVMHGRRRRRGRR